MKKCFVLLCIISSLASSQPQEYQSRGAKSYIVNYGAMNGDPFLVRFGAKRFVLFDESSSRDIKLAHAVNPNLPILHYKDIVALHSLFDEYAAVNLDEHAFLHSADPASLSFVERGDSASLFWFSDRRTLDIAGYRIYHSADSLGPWNILIDSIYSITQCTLKISNADQWIKIVTQLNNQSELNYGLPVRISSTPLKVPRLAVRSIGAPRDTSSVQIHIEAESIGEDIPDSVVLVMDINRDNTVDTLRERWKMTYTGSRWITDKIISISGITTHGGYEFSLFAYKNKKRFDFPEAGIYSTNLNNRIMNDYYNFFVMDIGSSTWRKAYINEVLKTFNTQGYNGLFEDDTWYKVERWGVDVYPQIGYSDFDWQKNLFLFLDSIKLSIAPRPAYFNGLYAAQAETLLVHTDGGMTEGFAYTSWSGYVTGDYWKVLCTAGLRAQHLYKKMFLALGGTPADDFEGRMYALCSYRLVADSLSIFANASDYQTFAHYPEFDIPLGKPLERADLDIDDLKRVFTPNNTAYYSRQFEYGTVVVNPDPSKFIVMNTVSGMTSPSLSGDSITGYSTVSGGLVQSHAARDIIFPKQARIYFHPAAGGNTLASPVILESEITAQTPNPDGSIPITVRVKVRDDSSPLFRADTTKPLWVAAYLGELDGPKELPLLNDGTWTPGVASEYTAQTILPVGTMSKNAQLPFLVFSTTVLVSGGKIPANIPSGDSTNLVLNYSYEIDNDEDGIPDLWNPYGKGFDYDTLLVDAKSGKRSVHVKNDSLTEFRGTYARITLNQIMPQDLILSGWSKALNVSGTKDYDYSLYIDIRYQDDTPLYGQVASFSPGTHDWEYSTKIIHPAKPIKDLSLYALFRKHTGEAWFDHLALRLYTAPDEVRRSGEPGDIRLSQNYPNPFSRDTNIDFQYPFTGERSVSFRIYDLFGREVLDLSEEMIHASSLALHASQLPAPGMYLYRLTIGTRSQTKMMSMIR